jgi:hypothetical protein
VAYLEQFSKAKKEKRSTGRGFSENQYRCFLYPSWRDRSQLGEQFGIVASAGRVAGVTCIYCRTTGNDATCERWTMDIVDL